MSKEHTVDSYANRVAMRRVTWYGFVARSPEEFERIKHDLDRSMTPSQRAETIWELVTRMPWGADASEYRLDRTVARVERRRG